MDAATLFLAVVIAGVNFGWQSASDGSTGYEYIVQVEPELVDAMQRGESIPIESNIPADVAPIRKVRVVVGRGELPRSPLRHTANFAGQPGWTPDRYPTAPPNAGLYTAQEQSLLNRTETAVTETGDAISDGVQSGLRSAQEQVSRAGGQVVTDTQSAAQQFGQQLQSAGNSLRGATEQTFDATGNQIRQAGNSLGLTDSSTTKTGAGGISAPPWPQANTSAGAQQFSSTNPATSRSAVTDTTAAPGMAVTRTATGWTSIGTNVAAPPLLNPPMPSAVGSSTNLRMAQSGTSGPMLSAPTPTTSSTREPLHSPLVDPSRQPAATDTTTSNWGNSWGTAAAAAPATIGRSNDGSRTTSAAGNTGAQSAQPRYPTQQDAQQAANRWGDPWAESDPWKQPPQNGSPQTPGGTSNAGQLATNNGWPTGSAGQAPAATNAAGQLIIGQAQPSANTAGFGANPGLPGGNPQGASVAGMNPVGGNNGLKPGSPAEQMPWMPLLLVTLGLVGSLSANFYLALSYIGARQKYVSLVQKTADTFRRATGAAAAA